MTAGLSWPVRVAAWDAALAAVRAALRGRGLREVTTPVRVAEPAPEPWIEPVAAPPGFLSTSPELAMKRMLCRGAGAIFEIAHVLRGAERRYVHAAKGGGRVSTRTAYEADAVLRPSRWPARVAILPPQEPAVFVECTV
ncbi:MAG TPA: hypothetical protein VFG69_16460, partial [Nannocystaceae bacterium]|nr:hypothetical protein [Nannocystaceae bacterium]